LVDSGGSSPAAEAEELVLPAARSCAIFCPALTAASIVATSAARRRARAPRRTRPLLISASIVALLTAPGGTRSQKSKSDSYGLRARCRLRALGSRSLRSMIASIAFAPAPLIALQPKRMCPWPASRGSPSSNTTPKSGLRQVHVRRRTSMPLDSAPRPSRIDRDGLLAVVQVGHPVRDLLRLALEAQERGHVLAREVRLEVRRLIRDDRVARRVALVEAVARELEDQLEQLVGLLLVQPLLPAPSMNLGGSRR
jgi:hypothetical protein